MERFGVIGDEPAGGTPQEFADDHRRDSARWGDVVDALGREDRLRNGRFGTRRRARIHPPVKNVILSSE